MPIYEYRCADCKRRVSIFFRSFSAAVEPHCPNCNSGNLSRLVSRVATLKGEDARMESMADKFSGVDENDPKSIARMMRQVESEMGDDSPELGPEFDEMVERLETGQSPDQIEKEMPGLADTAASGLGAPDAGGEM